MCYSCDFVYLPMLPTLYTNCLGCRESLFCFLTTGLSCSQKLRHDCVAHDSNRISTNHSAAVLRLTIGVKGQRSVVLNWMAECFVFVCCRRSPAVVVVKTRYSSYHLKLVSPICKLIADVVALLAQIVNSVLRYLFHEVKWHRLTNW